MVIFCFWILYVKYGGEEGSQRFSQCPKFEFLEPVPKYLIRIIVGRNEGAYQEEHNDISYEPVVWKNLWSCLKNNLANLCVKSAQCFGLNCTITECECVNVQTLMTFKVQ